MDNEFGSFKELNDVVLRTTSDINIGGETIEKGEIIAYFDKIQIAGLQTVNELITANGGWDNRPHVFWEVTKEIDLNFSQGVFSNSQLAIATNSKMYKIENNKEVLLNKREFVESDANGQVTLKYIPIGKVFLYNCCGKRVEILTQEGSVLTVEEPYQELIAFYDYAYVEGGRVIKLGQELLNGYLSFEGKTREKDNKSGRITTCVIKIPKLRIVGGLSIHLGAQANPVVANFQGIGVPVGERRAQYVTELFFLNDDIDKDF